MSDENNSYFSPAMSEMFNLDLRLFLALNNIFLPDDDNAVNGTNNNTSNPIDPSILELCDVTFNMCTDADIPLLDESDEFVMQKMQDRPPCYDNIENDRIAIPIADCDDEAPIGDFYDEPPPMYDDFHYVRPCTPMPGTLNPSMSNGDEVAPPNYSTDTEIPKITNSEAVIRLANEENIIQTEPPPPMYDDFHYVRPCTPMPGTLNPSMSNSDEVAPPNYSTDTAIPKITNSEAVIRLANEENITQTEPVNTNQGRKSKKFWRFRFWLSKLKNLY